MSESAALVRRQGPQSLRFPGVTLYYQLFPGVHGEAGDRAIAGVQFAVYYGGQLQQNGQTGLDGEISVVLPNVETSFEIEIFGQRTTFRVQETPDALELPTGMQEGVDMDFRYVGVSQRLAMLGYLDVNLSELPETDTMNRRFDKAILDFQVNEGFEPTGVLTQEMIDRLRQRAGV